MTHRRLTERAAGFFERARCSSAIRCRILAGLVVLFATGNLLVAAEKAVGQRAEEVIASEDELSKLIAELDKPATRMLALSRLIRFSWLELYNSHLLMNTQPMVKRAAEAIRKRVDIETVSAALDSAESDLQFWGLWFWQGGTAKARETQPNPWLALMPKVKRLAVEGDGRARCEAVRALWPYPANKEFLAQRVEVETSADVLLHLVYEYGGVTDGGKALNPLLLRLLHHADETVRHDTLVFIGWNKNSAPMWQVSFDMPFFERALELTEAKSEKERAAAAFALDAVKSLDSDRSRVAFIRLSKDPCDDVRWRAAWGLNGQLDREDMKQVVAALLRDPVPRVRYTTILAVGARNHVDELAVLARCPDQKVAKQAAEMLKFIQEGGGK